MSTEYEPSLEATKAVTDFVDILLTSGKQAACEQKSNLLNSVPEKERKETRGCMKIAVLLSSLRPLVEPPPEVTAKAKALFREREAA